VENTVLLNPCSYAEYGRQGLVPGIYAFSTAAPNPAGQYAIGQQLAAPLFVSFRNRHDHHIAAPAVPTAWLAGIAGKPFARFAIRRVPDIGFKLGDFRSDGIARPFRQRIPSAEIGAKDGKAPSDRHAMHMGGHFMQADIIA
jgi:hypothetical protein